MSIDGIFLSFAQLLKLILILTFHTAVSISSNSEKLGARVKNKQVSRSNHRFMQTTGMGWIICDVIGVEILLKIKAGFGVFLV